MNESEPTVTIEDFAVVDREGKVIYRLPPQQFPISVVKRWLREGHPDGDLGKAGNREKLMLAVAQAEGTLRHSCPGCWRFEPLTHTHAPLEVCDQCHKRLENIGRDGPASEGGKLAQRLIDTWARGLEAKNLNDLKASVR